MSSMDFSSMTVVELRKQAKQLGIPLKAGMNKKDIVEHLTRVTGSQISMEENREPAVSEPEKDTEPAVEEAAPVTEAEPEPAPAADVSASAVPDSEPAADVSEKQAQEKNQFRAAWHSPANAPARQGPTYGSRPSWQAPTAARGAADPYNRTPTQPRKPAAYAPRFGPDASQDTGTSTVEERPATWHDSSFATRGGFGPRRTESPVPAQRPRSEVPVYEAPRPQTSFVSSRSYPGDTNSLRREGAQELPALSDLLADTELGDCEGIFEMHPDGYGFLRTPTFLPSNRDVYVSIPQARRYGLKTGDMVTGKLRPPRDGDKYMSLLYVTTINGKNADEPITRTPFDELTPVYPRTRLKLDDPAHPEIRFLDLITPVGLGQRALCLYPAAADKVRYEISLVNAITSLNPDVVCIMLLIDRTPEDVTMIRSQTTCQVLASTFDQSPEMQLRLVDMVQERSQRLAELGKNVVLIVDSITKLVKTYTISAAQQLRNSSGTVNPASLFRAKKLFGAARSLNEGGSLTIFAAMDVDTGNKVDDTVVEEFRQSATLEVVFDAAIARKNIFPPINIQYSRSRQGDLFLSEQEREGRDLLREMLASSPAPAAVQQLNTMISSIPDNRDMLLKVKDLAALMTRGK